MDNKIIFTSVVIASIISSIISGIFLIISDIARRKHERKKILIETAVKLVELYDKKTNKFIDIKAGKIYWKNQSYSFNKFYSYLEEIWNKGRTEKEGFDSPLTD